MQWTAKREATKRDAIQQFLGAVSKSSVSSVAKTSEVIKIALIVVSILIVNSGTVVRSIRGCRLLCCPRRPESHRKKEFFWALPDLAASAAKKSGRIPDSICAPADVISVSRVRIADCLPMARRMVPGVDTVEAGDEQAFAGPAFGTNFNRCDSIGCLPDLLKTRLPAMVSLPAELGLMRAV
jgi:hypothetical protein